MLRRCGRGRPALCSIALLLAASPGWAESGLLLEYPVELVDLGAVPASTYDVDRKRVGTAHLSIEKLENGDLRMESDSGFTGGERTLVTAVLAPVDDASQVRLLQQESRTFDSQGNARGQLTIDHTRERAICRDAAGKRVGKVSLPSQDRVVNVPLNLLFLPLVRGETDEIRFQLFLCGWGARLLDFTANRAPASRNGNGSGQLVEVRYGPDFGVATLVASSFVPRLSFWFDQDAPHRWAAHRLPLYGNGPEVFVVREGVPPRWLGDD